MDDYREHHPLLLGGAFPAQTNLHGFAMPWTEVILQILPWELEYQGVKRVLKGITVGWILVSED